MCCLYNLRKDNTLNHISHRGLDNFLSHYDNILFLEDSNSQASENCVNGFCNVYNLSNLVKEPTCFKNTDNPSYVVDLFLTNRPKCFQSTMTIETGISDFHEIVITVLKIFYKKQKPKIVHYRNYKTFNTNLFKEEFYNELLSIDHNNAELIEFTNTVLPILYWQAPIKRKNIHANNSTLMTKELRAAIMHRSKLGQKFLKERTNDSLNISTIREETFVSAFYEKRKWTILKN